LKRSEALQSLSRDHHHALTVAQRLRRADDPQEAATGFLEFWRQQGALHFRVEEEVLLPVWAELGIVDPDAAARLSREHLEIRGMARRLTSQPVSLPTVQGLGERLAEHVRFEERELFPLIEQDLGEADLARLARAVADAEREAGQAGAS
jgi:hemerythrin-like domain-containing protein